MGATDALDALYGRFRVSASEALIATSAAGDAAAVGKTSEEDVSVSVLEIDVSVANAGGGDGHLIVTQFSERRSKLAGGEEMVKAAEGPLMERLGLLSRALAEVAASHPHALEVNIPEVLQRRGRFEQRVARARGSACEL